MKKYISLILLSLFTLTSYSQQVIEKPSYVEINSAAFKYRKGAALACSFLAGISQGFQQVNRHHFYVFEEKHPNHSDFWGPNGWKNKWAKDEFGEIIWGKEAFPLSSTALVIFTDADHFFKAGHVSLLSVSASISLYGMERYDKWWHYAIEIAANSLVRAVGFELIHGVIYKPNL